MYKLYAALIAVLMVLLALWLGLNNPQLVAFYGLNWPLTVPLSLLLILAIFLGILLGWWLGQLRCRWRLGLARRLERGKIDHPLAKD